MALGVWLLGVSLLFLSQFVTRRNVSAKAFRDLAMELDGVVASDSQRRWIEIPSHSGSPIEFSYSKFDSRRDTRVDLTFVSTRIHLSKAMKLDLAPQPSARGIGGYDLLRFLIGATPYEDLSGRLESGVVTGDTEFDRAYRTFSNQPQTAVAVTRSVKQELLNASSGAFRLAPPRFWEKTEDHTLRAVFRGHVTDRAEAQRIVLAMATMGAAILEEVSAIETPPVEDSQPKNRGLSEKAARFAFANRGHGLAFNEPDQTLR